MKTHGERLQGKVFKVAKQNFDQHKGTVMADMFDEEGNRMYCHIHENGDFMFEVFYLKDRYYGHTDEDPKELANIYALTDLLKLHGIQLVFTATKQFNKMI